jgi:hypothetical protein
MSAPDSFDDVELVVRLVGQVVRTGPFPPPDPYQSWSKDAVMEQATRLYESKKGAAIVAEARVAAGGDPQHLERRLLRTIRNVLIDEAKATPVGRMRGRLATMLRRESGFVRVSGPGVAVDGWARVGSVGALDRALWQGDRSELEDAAWTVPVPPTVVFGSSGPPSRATRQALLDVLCAVFDAADGLYLRDQELARVMVARFEEFLDVDSRDVAEFASALPDGAARVPDGTDVTADVDAADLADWLWVEFSADERTTVSVLEDLGSAEQDDDAWRDAVVAAVGCGQLEAEALIESVQAQVRTWAVDEGTAARVITGLFALRSRTGAGPESDEGSTP